MRSPCTGDVSSLRGHLVMLTGKTRIDGQHVQRTELPCRIMAAGAGRVLQDGTANRQVTLLVQGDLSTGWLTDPINLRSKKAVFVDGERGRGNHICVIDDVGVAELLCGRPASCLRTRALQGETVEFRSPAVSSPIGDVLRRRRTPDHSPIGLEMDLAGLDRGTSAHEDLIERLQAFLSPTELRGTSGSGPGLTLPGSGQAGHRQRCTSWKRRASPAPMKPSRFGSALGNSSTTPTLSGRWHNSSFKWSSRCCSSSSNPLMPVGVSCRRRWGSC